MAFSDKDRYLMNLYQKMKGSLNFSTNHPESVEVERKYGFSDPTFTIPIVDRVNGRIDDIFQDVNEFTTELSFEPPLGLYLEIHGTSLLVKKGYFLPHPLIIQPQDRNIVKISLFKYKDVDDLSTPMHGGLVGVLKNCNYSHIRKKTITHIEKEKEENIGNFFHHQNDTKKTNVFIE